MCDRTTCKFPCGEEEFRRYDASMTPERVMYPTNARSGTTRYGVTISHPAHQWEIVAVQSDHPRHLAYISTLYCLDRVMEMASQIAG
jgi:hypothetical protein